MKNKAKGKSFFKRLETKPQKKKEKSTFDQYVDMVATKVEPFVQREIEKVKKVVKQENPKADKEEIKDEVEEKIDVVNLAAEVIEDVAEENPSIPDEVIEKIPKEEIADIVQQEIDALELDEEKTFGPDISNYNPRDKEIAEVFRMIGPNLKNQQSIIRDIMEEIPDMNLEPDSNAYGDFIKTDLFPFLDELMQILGNLQKPIALGEAEYDEEDIKNSSIYKFIFNRLNPKLLDVFGFEIIDVPMGTDINHDTVMHSDVQEPLDIDEYRGKVISVVKAGIIQNDKVIRASVVFGGRT